MKIRLASPISIDSIVDGIGLRTVIWTQGCVHHCFDCHNPDTWDLDGGFEYDADKLIEDILGVELQSGVTFSGGDPFCQADACAYIASELKKYNKNIWCYTGFLYEDFLLRRMILKGNRINDFLENIDVLVDGPFISELKSFDCRFRGSSNQRLIDVPESLKQRKVVLWGEG